MAFYEINLAVLAALLALMLFQRHRRQRLRGGEMRMRSRERASARRFQHRFLSVYAFAVGADWLQASAPG